MMSARAGKRSRGDTNPSPVSIVEYNYASVESKIDASKHTQLVKALLRTDIFDSESILVNFPNKQESDLRTPPPSVLGNFESPQGLAKALYEFAMLGKSDKAKKWDDYRALPQLIKANFKRRMLAIDKEVKSMIDTLYQSPGLEQAHNNKPVVMTATLPEDGAESDEDGDPPIYAGLFQTQEQRDELADAAEAKAKTKKDPCKGHPCTQAHLNLHFKALDMSMKEIQGGPSRKNCRGCAITGVCFESNLSTHEINQGKRQSLGCDLRHKS